MNKNPKNKFCANCGSIINQGNKYCSNCGNMIIIDEKVESIGAQQERENNFLNKYKPGIILFSIITFFMLLFPPIEWGTRYSNGSFNVRHTSFHFLLNFSDTGRDWGMGINEAHINILQLFVQIMLVAISSIFFQLYNVQIKKWWKKNTF